MNWYLAVLQKYAVFDGRARRKEYWMFVLFNILVSFVLGFILGYLHMPKLTSVYSLAVLLPTIGVSIRRLHDTNRSGWWILMGLIPCIGWIVLIVFYATEGDRGENQYGTDPKELPDPA